MSITFKCGECGKEVKAPDTAAGKVGKCPFCQQSVFIPDPNAQGDDELPLADIDEEEERRLHEQRLKLIEQEKALLAETGGPVGEPLDDKEDVDSEDLHHFVVNYCLDMAKGQLQRAETYVPQLRKHGALAIKAVDDFATGRTTEAALKEIPSGVLQGFLSRLKGQLR